MSLHNHSLLLVTHGTTDDAGMATSTRLAAEVQRELPGVVVRLAFADVRGPTVAEVVPELLAHGDEVVLVPAFLTTGYHVCIDLPA